MNSAKLFLILTLIFFLHIESNSQHLSSLKLNHTGGFLADSSKSLQYHSSTNAFLAGVLSLIGPGFALGQIYNNDWPQFCFHITISSACLAGLYISLNYFLNGSFSAGNGVLLGTAFIYTANWVWSVIDAASTADKIDRQKLKTKHPGIMNRLRFGILYDQNKNLKLKFAIRL
jgi:hypothetical protein